MIAFFELNWISDLGTWNKKKNIKENMGEKRESYAVFVLIKYLNYDIYSQCFFVNRHN